MAVSRHAIDTVFAQLKLVGGQTYEELAKATGFSHPTVKNAVSYLKMQGSVSLTHTRPIVIKAIETPPMPGQTLIVREVMPPQELNSKVLADMKQFIIDGKHSDPVLGPVFERIHNATPEQLKRQLIIFVNLSEAIREKLTSTELDLEDIDPNSLKGKK